MRPITKTLAPSSVRTALIGSLKCLPTAGTGPTDKGEVKPEPSIPTDYKNGSDKVDDSTLRLTLLRSPGTDAGYTADQGNQDWGHHEITFGIAGHRGDWRDAGTDWQGYRLNNPIRAFAVTAHSGSLGRKLSLFSVDSKHVRLFAMKKEKADETRTGMVETLPCATDNVSMPVKFAASRRAVHARSTHRRCQ